MELMDVGEVRRVRVSQGGGVVQPGTCDKAARTDFVQSQIQDTEGFILFKETIKKKKKKVAVHLSCASRPLAVSISQPGGGSLSENEALAERD